MLQNSARNTVYMSTITNMATKWNLQNISDKGNVTRISLLMQEKKHTSSKSVFLKLSGTANPFLKIISYILIKQNTD
jgi:hypothetical protein